MRTLTPSQAESNRLDELIQKLKNSGLGGEHDLLVEHLQTAHAYLLGSMPEECEHNLHLALHAAEALPDAALRQEIRDTIAPFSHDAAASGAASPARPPRLKEYFHGSEDVSFGIFYPKKHVVAVFFRPEAAEWGRQALLAAGFRIWEVIAVPGEEVEKLLEQMKENRTLWDELVVEISRVLDTEIGLMDRYGLWARAGASFLLAYSATEGKAEEVAKVLKPLDPIAMHWFMAGYIQHLLPTG